MLNKASRSERRKQGQTFNLTIPFTYKKTPKLFVADGLTCPQLDQHMLRLIVSDYAILRVASPPPTLSVVDFRPVGKL
jgi:hypothetical protein